MENNHREAGEGGGWRVCEESVCRCKCCGGRLNVDALLIGARRLAMSARWQVQE